MKKVAVMCTALVLAGCGTTQHQSSVEEAWFADCVSPAAPQALDSGRVIELPCFTGGTPTAVTGPAVVNLWASWCAPCRQELPVFQRLADSGRVPVLGVVTLDDRPRALSTAKDLGVRFPTLYDPEGRVHKSTGKAFLPITLFVGSDGQVVHTYTGAPLNDVTLGKLVEEHLS